MKLVSVSGERLIRILVKTGFIVTRQKGSHVQLEDTFGRRITIPLHSGREIGRGLLRKILRDAEISREEFEELKHKSA